jgi:hypothetical protein
MSKTLKALALAGCFAINSGFGTGAAPARAHEPTTGYYNNGGYSNGGYSNGGYSNGGYSNGGYSNGGYSNGGYAVPTYQYYGNGGHDAAPHLHNTQTPIGNFSYYGTGRHDYRPHAHTQTPYGVTSYSGGPFIRTQSYAPPTPYYYRPW